MWKFGIASIASLCVLTGGVAVPMVLADAPTTAPAGTDKIEGKVVDQNNQPVANATVNLYAAQPKPAQKPAADPTTVAPKPSDDAPATPAKPKRTPLQTTTTGNDGTFSFTGLADGKYQVSAKVRGVGQGHDSVTLDSGNADQTVTITLAPKKPKPAQQ
jgi:protocatechuate 3,4-dioxygenase beta subunit